MRIKAGFKRVFMFIKSMKLGLILLGLLGVMSLLGSIVPHGEHNIYHSFYFAFLFVLLCINMLFCSITRLNSLLQRMNKRGDYSILEKFKTYALKSSQIDNEVISYIFKYYGFNKYYEIEKKGRMLYHNKRNTFGYLGSWFIHAGMLAIILFYVYGQFTYFTSYAFGVAGETLPVAETGLILDIKEFDILYREDGSVEQYITSLNLSDKVQNISFPGEVKVNSPLRYKEYSIYQSGTGWASNIDLYKEQSLISRGVVYEGSAYINESEKIALQFVRFYPDEYMAKEAFPSYDKIGEKSKIIYSIFYGGEMVTMGTASPGEDIRWNEYRFTLYNPRRYTYLEVNKLKGKSGAFAGACLIIAGLFLSFYIKPVELIILVEQGSIHLYGKPHMLKTFFDADGIENIKYLPENITFLS